MKQILFGIFAHPDDEGFGPSGTLIKMVENGVDVHLLCLTKGEAGINVDGLSDLGSVRSEEWRKAGELIGATSMKQFDFGDGQLCNALYHEIAGAVEAHVTATLEHYQEPTEVEFLTFDTTGMTGHLDHIAASMIATYVFLRQVQKPGQTAQAQFTRLRYFCLPPTRLDNDTSFVYWPTGRTPETIDETVDVSAVFEKKLAVMRTHHSQRGDATMLLETLGDVMKHEAFRFLTF